MGLWVCHPPAPCTAAAADAAAELLDELMLAERRRRRRKARYLVAYVPSIGTQGGGAVSNRQAGGQGRGPPSSAEPTRYSASGRIFRRSMLVLCSCAFWCLQGGASVTRVAWRRTSMQYRDAGRSQRDPRCLAAREHAVQRPGQWLHGSRQCWQLLAPGQQTLPLAAHERDQSGQPCIPCLDHKLTWSALRVRDP
jgi:hypothetical protein